MTKIKRPYRKVTSRGLTMQEELLAEWGALSLDQKEFLAVRRHAGSDLEALKSIGLSEKDKEGRDLVGEWMAEPVFYKLWRQVIDDRGAVGEMSIRVAEELMASAPFELGRIMNDKEARNMDKIAAIKELHDIAGGGKKGMTQAVQVNVKMFDHTERVIEVKEGKVREE